MANKNTQKKVKVDWAYAQESPGVCDRASVSLEPAEQEETVLPQTDTISGPRTASI